MAMWRLNNVFRPTTAEHGFTLIEMLVALSIMSIAALALLRLDSYAVVTAGDLASRSAAQLVAHNRSVEIATDPQPPVLGRTTLNLENGGRRFAMLQNVAATPDQRLVRVDLLVREVGGTGGATLTFIRRVK